jgi:pyridoxamine 5'-phosphate oxidase
MSRSPIPESPSEEAYRAEDDQGEVFTKEDPIALFAEWLHLAGRREPNDPNAMALATVDADGLPDARMVLLKEFDARGLAFYTNTESAKGSQLSAHPKAAVVFHWRTIRRQVRARGPIERVSDKEADDYFATRARTARIGAWASTQSRPMDGRFALEKAVAAKAAQFGLGDIPRPPFWSGYRLIPLQIEFWVNRPFRLHDRLQFFRAAPTAPWTTRRLFP